MVAYIQAESFQETVLKVEGDKVSAAECSHHLEMLKGDIMLRKAEKYCDAATEKEMKTLIELHKIERKSIEDVFCAVYGKFDRNCLCILL